MTTYGIDAHALLRAKATGVERYVSALLGEMMKLPLRADERVVLYGNGPKPVALELPTGWSWKELKWIGRGWTHGRLSLEMVMHPPTVLFVPAHEIPAYVRSSTKVVTTIHDVVFKRVPSTYSTKGRARQEAAVRRAAARANKILAVSEATKLDLAEFYRVSPERVSVTHLAPSVVAAPAEGALERHHVRPKNYFVFVGRLEAKKNIAHLVKAFALVKRKLGQGHPLKLVLVGSFGFGEQDIHWAIKNSGFANDILLLGYIPDADVSALLKESLGYVFPSLGEGFGIPVLEAMQAGAPVIASDIPALREVGGEACLYASPTDVAAFALALEQFVFDESLRSDFAEKGRRRLQEFSWHKTAAITWEALRSV